MRQKNAGFTLIELLVVIAIIAILAAILFPVFATAREKARQTTCASNEKQLGLATLQYVQDYDESPPCGLNYDALKAAAQRTAVGIGWAGQIYPYVKSFDAFSCPDDKLYGVRSKVSNGSVVGATVAYAYNPNLVVGISNTGVQLFPVAKLTAPVETVMYTEIDMNRWLGQGLDLQSGESVANAAGGVYIVSPMTNGAYGCNNSFSTTGCNSNTGFVLETGPMGCQGTTGFYQTPYFPTGRHTGGSNYVFWDGHVKWLKGTSVSIGENARINAPPWTANSTIDAVCTAGYGIAGGTEAKMNGVPITATMSVL